MTSQYQTIATDLRRRIGASEWGPAGSQLPTVTELMGDYDVAGQTIRNAQALLVDEGLLDARQGIGVFVARVPDSAGQNIEGNLNTAAACLRQAQAQLQMLLDGSEGADPSPEQWGRAHWFHCRTCDAQSGVTRGWVSNDDATSSVQSCHELGHEVVSGPGALPDRDLAEADAVEDWWEAAAHEQETVRLLLAGEIRTARAHARRADELNQKHHGFTTWRATPVPPSDRAA